MIRMIALALALGVGAAPAYAEGGEDHKAKEAAPSSAKVQILNPPAAHAACPHRLTRRDGPAPREAGTRSGCC
jgi:hypothetical protein